MIFNFIKQKILYILSFLTLIMGGWNINLQLNSPDIASLKSTVDKLRSKNKELTNSNKSLTKNQDILKKQHQKIRSRILSHRKSFTKKITSRAKSKIASAPAKAIPFLGVASIVAMTTLDINAYCGDIEEVKSLEKDLFDINSSDNNISLDSEIEKVCNYNIEKELKPIIEAKYNSSINTLKESYSGSIEWISSASNSSVNFAKDSFDSSTDWLKDVSSESVGFFKSVISNDYNNSKESENSNVHNEYSKPWYKIW